MTGLSLNAFVTREVLEPLGMEDSRYVWAESDARRMADGHDFLGESRLRQRREGDGDNAAASLVTTAPDYAKFRSAVIDGQGLEPSTWSQVFEPRVPVVTFGSKERVDEVFWGLGFGIQTGHAGPAFFHWGDNPGFKAYMIGYRDRGKALVYFTNSDDGLSIAADVVAAFVEDSHDALRWLDYDAPTAPERRVARSIGRAFLDDGVEAGTSSYEESGGTPISSSTGS